MACDGLLKCRAYVLDALREQMKRRALDGDWIDRERFAVAMAANEWATAQGIARRVRVADVERIEPLAVGHVDYAPKLALYIAEFVYAAGPTESNNDN